MNSFPKLSLKYYWGKLPNFIKQFIWVFFLCWIFSMINVFTFRIFPPIIYSIFFFIIYPYRIRKDWLWAFKLKYIISYIKGYLDLRLMIVFGIIYLFLISLPLGLLSEILPIFAWHLFQGLVPRNIIYFLFGQLPQLASVVVILMVVLGFIMKIIRFLNTGAEDKKNDSADKRLIKIKQLLDDNIISKEEYEEQRRKIIGDI